MNQKIKKQLLQPVIKQNAESDFSARIEVLEEEIMGLRTLIEKEAHSASNIQKPMGSAGFEPATSAMSRRGHNRSSRTYDFLSGICYLNATTAY